MFSTRQIAWAAALRRHFHQTPELAFEEHQTAQRVAHELKALGYQPRTGVGGTGVVADIGDAAKGPTIALRADMDALPITEQTDNLWCSQRAGLMHACGHDGHTASLLLAAARLIEQQHTLAGRVRLIFQPTEETIEGARRMIAAGVLEEVAAIYGYHNRPTLELGKLAVRAGPTSGGGGRYSLIIDGQGAHSTRPHLSVDAIYIATQLVQSWQGLVSRAISPLSSAVLSVTRIAAGDNDNLGTIAARAEINFSLRYDNLATRAAILERLQALTEGICSAWGARWQLHGGNDMPPVINSERETALLAAAFTRHFGSTRFELLKELPTLGGDDFAYYLTQVPGALFYVGAGTDHADLHSAHFDYPDAILPIAAEALVCIAHCALNAAVSSKDK